jgi:hypothetical protein
MDQELREKKYNEVFEAMYRYLEQRRRDDPAFNIARLEDMLNAAYFRQGDDWLGKGVLYEIKMAATVAAYESYLAVWREEEEQNNKTAKQQIGETS